MDRCGRPAVAYVQHAGAALPACTRHAREHGTIFERITRLRRCELAPFGCTSVEPSAFAVVIAEAIPRCSCGARAEFCAPCAARGGELRPLARAVRR